MTDVNFYKTLGGMSKILCVETYEGKPTTDKTFACSICGTMWQGWGNNPAPVTDGENDRCCNPCNTTHVLPARIGRMRA